MHGALSCKHALHAPHSHITLPTVFCVFYFTERLLGVGARDVELEAGGRVHAGITAAHLTLLPAHGTTPACVYAQSCKALLLRPTASKEASGQQHTHAVTGCVACSGTARAIIFAPANTSQHAKKPANTSHRHSCTTLKEGKNTKKTVFYSYHTNMACLMQSNNVCACCL